MNAREQADGQTFVKELKMDPSFSPWSLWNVLCLRGPCRDGQKATLIAQCPTLAAADQRGADHRREHVEAER